MTRRTPRQPPTRQDLAAHSRWSPRRAIPRQPRSAADTNAAPPCVTTKIVYEVTNDIPDGRQWPPPQSDVLWAVVRRANGRTLWRAIQLAQVRSAAHGLLHFSDRQQPNLKDHTDDTR